MKNKLEYLPITKLSAYETNSRTHSKDQIAQIAASISEFGFTNPVLIDQENTIIAGHGRVEAAKQLGLDEVPCIRLSHLTEFQKKAYVIADNKLALNAGWDELLLRNEVLDLQDLSYDLKLLGFSEEELNAMLADIAEEEMPDLASGDRQPIQQITFILHDDQVEIIKDALRVAKDIGPFIDTGNENVNGNAIARICEIFLGHYANS